MNLKNIKVGDSIEFYQPGYKSGKLIYCKHKISKVTKKVAITEKGLKFDIPSGYYLDEVYGKIPNPIAEKVNKRKLTKPISVKHAHQILQKMTPKQQLAVKRMIYATVKDTIGKYWKWEEFSQEQPQIAVRGSK